MNKNRVKPSLPMLFFTLTLSLISGCAQQPTAIATDNTAQLTQTAIETIDKAVYINTLFTLCAQLGNEAEYEAIALQQDWLEKNWPSIAAADSYYSQQLQSSMITYKDKQLALAAILLSHSAQTRAANELGLKQRTSTNQQKVCVRRMQTIAQNEMTITTDPQALVNLTTIQNKYTGDQKSITPIPALAGNVSINNESGRSFFVMAEQIKKECADAQFIVIDNKWPQEAYASYCGKTPKALISCDWGKCHRL